MFPPVRISIPLLLPFHKYALLIRLSGPVCLWLTRYTHQLARCWGSRYYVLSASIRPSGMLLIAIGWLAAAAEPTGVTPRTLQEWLRVLEWRRGPTVLFCVSALHCISMVLSHGFDLWAVAPLGLRRSLSIPPAVRLVDHVWPIQHRVPSPVPLGHPCHLRRCKTHSWRVILWPKSDEGELGSVHSCSMVVSHDGGPRVGGLLRRGVRRIPPAGVAVAPELVEATS